MADKPMRRFHPVVARWFEESFSAPTPAQAAGWASIAQGSHTLISAPTGSGKTLAAFLYAINELVTGQPLSGGMVHTLYVSPLRALATDIERNLERPLAGVRRLAERMGLDLPPITTAVRTGDTPPAERKRMVRRPPDLLITTPESLHLILSSPRARQMLLGVRYVILDEIHSLCSEKRGAFVSLLLERLEAGGGPSPVRIGLSATQHPLERVARFLGGYMPDGTERSVQIVDIGGRKNMDVRVVLPVEDLKSLPDVDGHGPTIWPSICALLTRYINEHTSTLVFANNRRVVERIAAEINRQAGLDLVRAHHSSVSKEQRQTLELLLKTGRLPGLVATSSLELGIDVGAVDLVCQVETPMSVASILQRIGRAGHVYRETSVGRLIPKTRSDLLAMAAMTRCATRGEISKIRIPRNPLDVLAQQLIAMVAMDSWDADDLYERVRCAGPFHELERGDYLSVLEMISGRFESPLFAGLRARIVWERAANRLHALPGSRHLVILQGGTIPDSAQYPMMLEDGGPRLGELDEEFVFEHRIGDTFVLGTGAWRIEEIRHDRVLVSPSSAQEAQMPFWRGEGLGHDVEFGARWGAFLRSCQHRLSQAGFRAWIAEECHLDADAAANLERYLIEQLEFGPLPTDETLLVDIFLNEMAEPRVAILSPFGRSFHLALWMALRGALRHQGREPPEGVYSNAGILLRSGSMAPDDVIELIRNLPPADVVESILGELRHSPYYALRFRRNATRALLLARSRPGKRIPLWLQRLRAHELLEYAERHPGFPIVRETYREILEDLLPLGELVQFLESIQSGCAEVFVRRGRRPSPFAASLLLEFTARFMYEEDRPPSTRDRVPDDGSVGELLRADAERVAWPEAGLIGAEAYDVMEQRLQGTGPHHRARDGAELVDLLQRIGDLSMEELRERSEPDAWSALPDLIRDERVVGVRFPGASIEDRWISAEDETMYRSGQGDHREKIVQRYVIFHAGRTRDDVTARYPGWERALEGLVADNRLQTVEDRELGTLYLDKDVLVGLRRLTLARRRKSIEPAVPAAWMSSVLDRQHLLEPLSGDEGLRQVLRQLAGRYLTPGEWEDIIALRVRDRGFRDVGRLVSMGEVEWRGRTVGGVKQIGLAPASEAGWWLPIGGGLVSEHGFGEQATELLAQRGALFTHQVAALLERSPSAVEAELEALLWQGRVTNDALLVARGSQRPMRRTGRWTRVAGEATDGSERDAALLRGYLHRYGIVCREILAREGSMVPWSVAYPMLSRMEWRGDVERGLFVSGLSGPQFAAIGERAALRRTRDPYLLLLRVNDPASLFGDVLPIVRAPTDSYVVRHHPGNSLVIRNGCPLLAIEAYGSRLIPLVELKGEERIDALRLLTQWIERPRRRASVRVETWDGRPVVETDVVDDLAALGFMKEDRVMIRYRDYGGTR